MILISYQWPIGYIPKCNLYILPIQDLDSESDSVFLSFWDSKSDWDFNASDSG